MTAKQTIKTKVVPTGLNGRGLTLSDLMEILSECHAERLSESPERQKILLQMIEGAFGEYYFDNKAASIQHRKFNLAAKKVATIEYLASTLQKQFAALDGDIADALYDPFRDRYDLLNSLLNLSSDFANPTSTLCENQQESKLMRRLSESPGLVFHDVLLPMLAALANSAETFERVNRAKENRGTKSEDPKQTLIDRLFSAYDFAHGDIEQSKDTTEFDGLEIDDGSDLTSFEYSEYKAVFVHRILSIANIPVSDVGVIGRDSKSPSRLVKSARRHTKLYDGVSSRGLASFNEKEYA